MPLIPTLFARADPGIIAQRSGLDTNPIHHLPSITTIVAVTLTITLYKRWRNNPAAKYRTWWTIEIAMFGLGTLTEALTTIFGWNETVFRVISGDRVISLFSAQRTAMAEVE